MATSKEFTNCDPVYDDYGHPILIERGAGGPFDANRGAPGRKRNINDTMLHHCSIEMWGGGRFVLHGNCLAYDGGEFKYIHQCDIRSFGLWDLFGAATECDFKTGQPTMAWYVNPECSDLRVEHLIPINDDADVQRMLRLCNSFTRSSVKVYTQDTNFGRAVDLANDTCYVIPHLIPKVLTAGLLVHVKFNVEERIAFRNRWTREQRGLEEKLGKTWYISDRIVCEPPCQNAEYNLRPLPCRGLSDRDKIVEDDPIGEYLGEIDV